MTRRAVLSCTVIATLLCAACTTTSAPEGPDPGAVIVSLTTPNSNDGGVRFLVTGGPIDSVTAGVHDVFHASIDGGTRVVVIGALVPSGIAQLWLPDRRNMGDYQIVVEEVATRGTFANRSVSGYSLTIAKP